MRLPIGYERRDMNTKQIEMILALAKYESIAKAADQLYISRQAIMKQLDGIEGELGFAVFERNYKGVALTEPGAVYVEGIRELKGRYEELLNRCAEAERPLTIRIPNRVFTIVDVVIEAFRKQYPDRSIQVVDQYRGKSGLKNNPQIDIINLFLAPGSKIGENELFIPLMEDPFICLVSQVHPLAQCGMVTAEELSHYHVAISAKSYQKEIVDFLGDMEVEELGFDTLTVMNACYGGMVYITHACYTPMFQQLSSVAIVDSPVKVNGLLVRKNHGKEIADFIEIAKNIYPVI